MGDRSHSQGKAIRVLAKCSACRKRKQKCQPDQRDWSLKQKCVYCASKNEPCGPNLRSNEDPVVKRSGIVKRTGIVKRSGQRSSVALVEANLQENTSAQGPEYPTQGSGTSRHDGSISESHNQAGGKSLRLANTDKGKKKAIESLSDEEIEEQASSKLQEINALGMILFSSASTFRPPSCRHYCDPPPFTPYIEQKFQSLLMHIYQLAQQANFRHQNDRSQNILLRLLRFLDKYPKLYDVRKLDTFVGMAELLARLGLAEEYEHMALKINNIEGLSTSDSMKISGNLLLESFRKTSDVIKIYFPKVWSRTFVSTVPSHGAIPHLHRAAQDPRSNVLEAILQSMFSDDSLPAISIEEGYPMINCRSLQQLSQVRALVDVRDFYGRTPLFVAAAASNEHCCWTLLRFQADPNQRDSWGHTILEVAARGGNVRVVKGLHTAGCGINPDISGCASSPLQAAIESDNYNDQVVQYLLTQGADVDVKRPYDQRNAIDLARDSSLIELEEQLRRDYSKEQQHSFGSF